MLTLRARGTSFVGRAYETVKISTLKDAHDLTVKIFESCDFFMAVTLVRNTAEAHEPLHRGDRPEAGGNSRPFLRRNKSYGCCASATLSAEIRGESHVGTVQEDVHANPAA